MEIRICMFHGLLGRIVRRRDPSCSGTGSSRGGSRGGGKEDIVSIMMHVIPVRMDALAHPQVDRYISRRGMERRIEERPPSGGTRPGARDAEERRHDSPERDPGIGDLDGH